MWKQKSQHHTQVLIQVNQRIYCISIIKKKNTKLRLVTMKKLRTFTDTQESKDPNMTNTGLTYKLPWWLRW